MIALILFIAFGLLFGYFATLNTSVVSVYLGSYVWENVPLYLVVLVCLALGISFAGLFSFVKSLSAKLALNKKEGELSGAKKEIAELTKTIHQLELENTRLKTKNGEEVDDDNSL